MGWVRTLERAGKRRLMRALGQVLHARPVEVEAFRRMRFERILVVRQHNQMGDMMLAIPALRAIRETYPGARIGVITSRLNRDVLVGHPHVDRVFTYAKRDPLTSPGLIREIRAERYDLAVILHTVSFSFTTLMLGVLCGAPVRIGSTSRAVGESLTGSYLSLTLPLPTERELETMNEAEHNLYPLRAVGIDTADLSPVMVPTAEHESWASGFAASCWRVGTIRLAIHPGAGKAENVWPAERFAAVVGLIARQHAVSVVVVEGPSDQASVAAFCRACRETCGVGSQVVSERRIGEVAALLRRSDLVLCNDTGVMHVSAAVGALTLAIFGKTDPQRWAPICENLHVVQSPDGTLAGLEAEVVSRRALSLLESIPRAESDLQR